MAMASAPFMNHLSKRFNFNVPIVIGVIVVVIAQVFAGLSTRVWQLILSQGVMFGLEVGFVSKSIQIGFSNESDSDRC